MKRAAFVTGGASGIGLSVCQHLARAGHSVAVAGEKMAAGVPAGRMGTGDDIAAACMYLVSDEASYFTGQTVSVNGGSFVGW
jgi:NAD(P)-dependent dehydrogenase (short-subunit alcohol dehydrogenase family)